MIRVLRLLVVLACLVAVQPSGADQPDFRLQVVPAIVYKWMIQEVAGRHHSYSILP